MNLLNAQCVPGFSIATSEGENLLSRCPGDGNSDLLVFNANVNLNSGVNLVYVVVDINNIILEILPSNTKDFENEPSGFRRVWAYTYTGELLAMPGDHAWSVYFSTGCWGISAKCIDILRGLNGGNLAYTDGGTERTITVGDGIADVLSFEGSNTSSSNYTYLITDENNIIVGVTDINSQNFEGAGEGVCRVWGLAYNGELYAEAGMDASNTSALADGCPGLSSNYLTVNRISGGDTGPIDDSLVELERSHIQTAKEQELYNDNEIENLSQINVFPNPAISFVKANYTVANDSETSIQLFRMTGNLIKQIQNHSFKGQNETIINVENLQKGMYFLVFENDDTVKIQRFIKH